MTMDYKPYYTTPMLSTVATSSKPILFLFTANIWFGKVAMAYQFDLLFTNLNAVRLSSLIFLSLLFSHFIGAPKIGSRSLLSCVYRYRDNKFLEVPTSSM